MIMIEVQTQGGSAEGDLVQTLEIAEEVSLSGIIVAREETGVMRAAIGVPVAVKVEAAAVLLTKINNF